jgi:general stress protein YciG
MSGTKEGGIKARETNYRKYGKDFYRKAGAIGGKLGKTGGFYANRELAREAGRKGGLKSRRRAVLGKKTTGEYIDF